MRISFLKQKTLFCFIVFSMLTGMRFPIEAKAETLRLAKIFGDHQVLQREKPMSFWGWAMPNEKVDIVFKNIKKSTKADQNGFWQVAFPAFSASNLPSQLIVSSLKEKIILNDMLVGDVWICSGQSNMEWAVKDCNYSFSSLDADKFPQIRHFKINHEVSLTKFEDINNCINWTVCNAQTVQNFSAVAYFFARELVKKYNIPIGLVNTSWGGSQIESWISKEEMMNSTIFKDYATNHLSDWASIDALSMQKIKQHIFNDKNKAITAAEEANYLTDNFDFTYWTKGTPEYAWDWQNIWAFRGDGFMATHIILDEDNFSKPYTLNIGASDLDYEVFINGKSIATVKNNKQKKTFEIPKDLLRVGKNNLILKQSFGNIAPTDWVEMGFKGKQEDFSMQSGNKKILFSFSNWYKMPSFVAPHFFVHSSNNCGTAIFNAMIAPITRLAMKGVIWYQGETNAERAYEYKTSFPMMIKDWRTQWKEDFPFLFVQLANFNAKNGNSNKGSEWAELREAQTITQQNLPKIGMAVLIDIGESQDIHPKNKVDVGKRLAAEAYKVAYNEANIITSPTLKSVELLGDKAIITLENAQNGLIIKDNYGYIKGFEVAAEDKVFYYAKAEMMEDGRIKVFSKNVQNIASVRYGWADDPNDVNIYNQEGFPLNPFRTDHWDYSTKNVHFLD